MTRFAVIGAGISGLTAALDIVDGRPSAEVVVYEAAERVGGKIRTTPFAGLPAVDEGADAFLRRVPDGISLAQRVGIQQFLAPAAGGAAVWWDRMEPIPPGLLLGMPTDVSALARSSLISWRGKLRAALEPALPRTTTEPDSLGAWVRARFGDEVHERLVDPLVGSIYAADTDRFSLAAVPQIAELATRERSVLIAARRRPPAAEGPVFAAPPAGMQQLTDAVAARVGAAGATIVTGREVASLTHDGTGWRVDDEPFDGVVLAVPAGVAARLLGDAGAPLVQVPTADIIMVTLAVPGGEWTRSIKGRSGFLVPKPKQRFVTAVSYGSQKWAHWQLDGGQLLRVSLGRDGMPVMHLDDEQVVTTVLDELAMFHGETHQPSAVRVTRWPAAFAQYRPHHDRMVADVETALPPGVALAGAGFHGIGIPACIRSGRRAAQTLLQHTGGLQE